MSKILPLPPEARAPKVDRLARLNKEDWKTLRRKIDEKGIAIVALDLPTSHAALNPKATDAFTGRMLGAINSMLLDMLAAVARKDYEDRRRRQAEGIAKAKDAGKFKGGRLTSRSEPQSVPRSKRICRGHGSLRTLMSAGRPSPALRPN